MENTQVNTEELNLELKRLYGEQIILASEAEGLRKQTKELAIIKNKNTAGLKNCEKRILEIENILLTADIFNETTTIIAKFTDFHLLSRDELTIITSGIDTTDYTAYGKPRIMDLEAVLTIVLKIKKLYPSFTFNMLRKKGQYDTLPPQNMYEYTFLTPEGLYLIYAGTD